MSQETTPQESLNDQLIVRREKMQELRDKGVNPFADRYERTHLSADLHQEFDEETKEEIEEKETRVSVAGRIVSKRGKGKAGFAHLQDKE